MVGVELEPVVRLDVFPLAIACAIEHGVADTLRLEGVSEGGMGGFARFEAFQEIGNLVCERVFITNLQSWNPPVPHVGLIAVGDVDAAPAPDDGLIVVVEVLEAMQVVEIPRQAGVFAVDLEGVEGFVTSGIASRLKQPERAVAEVAEERAGVIDMDRFFLAGLSVDPFLDEGFGHSADIVD